MTTRPNACRLPRTSCEAGRGTGFSLTRGKGSSPPFVLGEQRGRGGLWLVAPTHTFPPLPQCSHALPSPPSQTPPGLEGPPHRVSCRGCAMRLPAGLLPCGLHGGTACRPGPGLAHGGFAAGHHARRPVSTQTLGLCSSSTQFRFHTPVAHPGCRLTAPGKVTVWRTRTGSLLQRGAGVLFQK